MRVASALAVLALINGAAAVAVDQAPFQAASKRKALKGRFLHITDIHPDPHYIKGGSFETACHRREKDTKGQNNWRTSDSDTDLQEVDEDDNVDAVKHTGAGRWGDKVSDCDSSMELVDLVFDWLKKEWAEEIDFVVWTGDNARHDSDRKIPRTTKEIFNQNRLIAQKMVDTFGKNFPIVPTLGNNDIWPHNIMQAGPNKITEEFLHIWKPWIPEDERHIFERGAHFAREVIPDRLAVISLNTLFWFASNSVVDGCQAGSGEPGSLHMDWLEVQLDLFRERGMQVWLIGHVPPHDGIYYDSCYLRYGDLALRYQDTIVGHLFGHQNIDHFFFLNVKELNGKSVAKSKEKSLSPNAFLIANDTEIAERSADDFYFYGPELPDGRPHLLQSGRFKTLKPEFESSSSKGDMLKKNIMNSFEELADPESFKHKDYTVINVGPSVLPAYIPSIRIFSYNISGVELEEDMNVLDVAGLRRRVRETQELIEEEDDATWEVGALKGNKKYCSKPKNMDKPRCSFKKRPRYASPEAPSRSNKPLTPLGYTQFFLPDVEEQNEVPKFKVEYTTFKAKELLPPSLSGKTRSQPPPVPYHLLPAWHGSIGKLTPEEMGHLDEPQSDNVDSDADTAKKGKDGKGGNKRDRKERFLQEIKRITPYGMKDLTINSYVKLGRALLNDKKLWNKFIDYMFVSSGAD